MTNEAKSPIEDFDWEAFEKGEAAGGPSREELTRTYDESLNTVKDKDVDPILNYYNTNQSKVTLLTLIS